MNIAVLLNRAATTYPDRPAVGVGKEVIWGFADLRLRASRLGYGLLSRMGLKPGDRVAIYMSNNPEYVETLLGIWWAGLVAVPVNAKLHANECDYVLGHSGASLCLTDEAHAPALASASVPVVSVGSPGYSDLVAEPGPQPDSSLAASGVAPIVDREPGDLAWLFYTSGTTGRPKGAMLTHRNLLNMTMSYHADVDSLTTDDVLIHSAPMSHGSGLYLLPFVGAAGCQVIPASGGFDTTETLELIEHWRSASMFMAPTMIHRLIGEHDLNPNQMSGLRTIVYGGGPMYFDDLERALAALGPRLAQIYGQGESPMTITGSSKSFHTRQSANSDERYEARLRSAGTARTGVEVEVVGADDSPLPVGEIGEIVVRGDVVMAGYWDNPEATKEALRGGWLHTGDVGFLDEEGFLTLQDRSKDLIISGGTNIYPREVEEILLQHPDVVEVSVVGKPEAEWGEIVVAFVVAQGSTVAEDSLERALDQWCLDNIARFKRPKQYYFVPELPKNNYGKVLKTELRERLAKSAEIND